MHEGCGRQSKVIILLGGIAGRLQVGITNRLAFQKLAGMRILSHITVSFQELWGAYSSGCWRALYWMCQLSCFLKRGTANRYRSITRPESGADLTTSSSLQWVLGGEHIAFPRGSVRTEPNARLTNILFVVSV